MRFLTLILRQLCHSVKLNVQFRLVVNSVTSRAMIGQAKKIAWVLEEIQVVKQLFLQTETHPSLLVGPNLFDQSCEDQHHDCKEVGLMESSQ